MVNNQKKWSLFNQLGAAYKKTFFKKNNLQCQQEVSEIWKKLKNEAEDLKDLENAVDKKISEWKVVEKEQKNSVTYFWGKASQKPQKEKTGVPTMVQRVVSSENSGNSGPVSVVTLDETPYLLQTQQCSKSQTKRSAPKQEEFRMDCSLENDILVGLYKKRELGMLSDIQRAELKSREKKMKETKKKINEAELNQKRQQRFRDERKSKLAKLDDDTRKKLTGSSTVLEPGRHPTIDNDSLIETIVRIAIGGSAADERRRTEVIRTVKTLDQLTVELQKEGYQL